MSPSRVQKESLSSTGIEPVTDGYQLFHLYSPPLYQLNWTGDAYNANMLIDRYDANDAKEVYRVDPLADVAKTTGFTCYI